MPRPERRRKKKGKARAPPPSDDEDAEAERRRKKKGKARAPPPSDDEDAEAERRHKKGARKDGGRQRMDAPAYSIREAENLGLEYILKLQDVAKKVNKPLEAVFRVAGWMHSDSAHARKWQRANVFSRAWSAQHPMDPSESTEARKARRWAAYRAKLAQLGDNPTEEQLADHFKDDYDFCVELDADLLLNATGRQRQRQVDNVAQQMSRLSLAAHLNGGLGVVGYVIDLRGAARGSVNSAMFGGGPAYTEMLRRFSGNFTQGLNDMSTILRSCDLRVRGLQEDSAVTALEDYEDGYFPDRNWNPEAKNEADQVIGLLYMVLRWDLSSRPASPVVLANSPRAIFTDIAYLLGIVLVNWPMEFVANMPVFKLPRKPAGRHWRPRMVEMVRLRRSLERESNRLGLRDLDALNFLHEKGAFALVPLPAMAELPPLRLLGRNPIVKTPAEGIMASKSLVTWNKSKRYISDMEEGEDSRRKWQPWWGTERDDGRVRDDDERLASNVQDEVGSDSSVEEEQAEGEEDGGKGDNEDQRGEEEEEGEDEEGEDEEEEEGEDEEGEDEEKGEDEDEDEGEDEEGEDEEEEGEDEKEGEEEEEEEEGEEQEEEGKNEDEEEEGEDEEEEDEGQGKMLSHRARPARRPKAKRGGRPTTRKSRW
ncbi:hypothetical protein BD626DRAFT_570875 [Schizophyllum amplum]|uniref:Uncharacterized protein n=1 Tax=Schizophyllum amplum TaxID=97359 RepID=A0A550C8V3_9AGAR|nr:hypothetical protein BD626DRAFT_570875 [Auriculariopsis ampla]